MDVMLLLEALTTVAVALVIAALVIGLIFLQFEKGNPLTAAILIVVGFVGMVGLTYLQMSSIIK